MGTQQTNLLRWKDLQRLSFVCFSLLIIGWITPSWSAETTGAALLQSRCAACHAAQADGKLDPIASQRKTPEGWQMTIDRMGRMYGVQLQADEPAQLVKHLSDHYGLAPSEVEPYRSALEKRNSTVVSTTEVPKLVQGACISCHSYARIALQRRTPDSWRRMADTKLALFTNTENVTASSGLLSTFWYDDTVKEVLPYMAKQFPLSTDAWSKWQNAAKPNYAGVWKVVGHNPGKGGDYTGRLTLKSLGDDRYEGEFVHEYADGATESGKTTGVIYTGFQWRGTAQLADGTRQQEIFFGNEDGSILSGRRLLTGLGDLGADEKLYRKKDIARLLTVIPTALKVGETQEVKLFGTSIPAILSESALNFGDGVKVQSVTRSSDDTISAKITVDNDAKTGARQVKISGIQGEASLQVYKTIDYIRLSPEQGFARPGGVKARKMMEQFEVIGYLNGKDGVKGTTDDIKVGRVGPITWTLEENVTRINDDDVAFVGKIDEHGLFIPAEDGPNPQRERFEHNVGDVWVEAWYTSDGAKRPMGARASVLVMPEKFSWWWMVYDSLAVPCSTLENYYGLMIKRAS
jgi:quinohemoprotein amine dehydrogenase